MSQEDTVQRSLPAQNWTDMLKRWAFHLGSLPLIGGVGGADVLLLLFAVAAWLHDDPEFFDIWLHMAFATVALGAFFWSARALLWRVLFWITASAVILFAKTGTLWDHALLERPFLLLVLLVILLFSRIRDHHVAVLSERTQELERRVSELIAVSNQLEASRAKLQEMAQNRADFLAQFSHELRTPLSAMIGYLEYLREDLDLQDNPEVVEILRKMDETGRHILRLVDNLLDLARIDAGEFDLQVSTFDVGREVRGIVETVRPLVARNKNDISLRVGSAVGEMRSDRTKVRQILYNLLSNAAKFTHQGQILVSVYRDSPPDGDWLIFEVRDTGAGMTEEELRTLFEPFKRGRRSRSVQGTGLGMPLTKRLVEQLGGTLEVSSQPGHGTTFVVRLPRQLRLDEETATAGEEENSAHPARGRQ